MSEKKLRVSPSRQDQRIDSQLAAIKAIVKGTNFNICCFLAKVKTDNPYGYLVPEDVEELEFTIKGVMRIEMNTLTDQGKYGYRFWRRLFGTSAGEKGIKAKTEAGKRRAEEFEKEVRRLFGKGSPREKGRSSPISWKSRGLFKAFEDGETARDFLKGCPLSHWDGIDECPLIASITSDEPLLLLQVHDVSLEGEGTFAALLKEYLNKDSKLFELVEDHSCRLGGG